MTVSSLPSPEERKWLGRYLRKLIDKMGWKRFVLAPVLLPSPKHFPDRWSGSVADVHRLTQRLMAQASLGDLTFSLSGFEGESDAWDAGTAGWFAGIVVDHCYFGVHVRQLNDPESAVGVMAHEVAHAFRHHHRLVAEDSREREELLTDLTTIYLGFGVFTTNNTDRYRSSGDSRETRWSVSSAGYLPPQAMAWLLALQMAARGDEQETKAIARELEPNQHGWFRDALDEIESEPSWLEMLSIPAERPPRWEYELVDVVEPDADDIEEPEIEDRNPKRNEGHTIQAVRKGGLVDGLLATLLPGLVLGLIVAMVAEDVAIWKIFAVIVAALVLPSIWAVAKTGRYVCAYRDCETDVGRDKTTCPGCGATITARVSEKQLRRILEEQLDRDSAEIDYPDCDKCQPEKPCKEHKATA